MRKVLPLLMASFPLLFVTACNRENASSHYVSAPKMEASSASAVATGAVLETMNTGGYTYILVDTGSEEVWAAAPECLVKVGDQVVVPEGEPMRNYHSNTLERDFELVYFANAFYNLAGDPLAGQHGTTTGHPPMAGHSSMASSSTPDEIDVSGVEKAEGGKTVAEIYAGKADLADTEVTLRGKVVKFNAQIMGKNWLHVRDGTGDAAAKTNDLTVTTDMAAQVGDTVLITGEIHLGKDFGYGYKYDVIMEDAQVVVE